MGHDPSDNPGAVHSFFWSPSKLGLASIPKKHIDRSTDPVLVPLEFLNPNGPLYRRTSPIPETIDKLKRTEEPLNDIFDIAFGIAPDHAVRNLFLPPLNIETDDPLENIGRELVVRYDWGQASNITQQDGL